MVLISGCATGGQSPPSVTTTSPGADTTTQTQASGADAETTTTTADRASDSDTTTEDRAAISDAGAVTDQYAFSEGETYTYGLVSQDRQFVWKVAGVSGSDVTVEIRADGTDGETVSVTHNGTQTASENTLFTNTSTTMPVFGTLHNAATITQGQSLTAGSSWSVTRDSLPRLFGFDWESASVEVTGTGSYAGVTYHNITITPESRPSTSATFGVNQHYPFALGWSSTGTATGIDTGVLVLRSADRGANAE